MVILPQAVEARIPKPEQLDAPGVHPPNLARNEELALLAGAIGSLSLERGYLELRRTDGNRYLVKPGARFELDRAETYRAALVDPVDVGAVSADGRVQLPKDTKLRILMPEGDAAGEPIFVRQSERLIVGPLVLPSTASAFVPDVRPDREAPPYLAAHLAAPSLDLDPAARTLRACLALGDEGFKTVPINSINVAGHGAAEIVVGLPSGRFPWLNWRRGQMASLAVVATDGSYAGVGQFVYQSRFWAFSLATLITLGVFLGLVWLRKASEEKWKPWFMGLFLGEDGQPSLSLFQILIWTIVTVWALLFVLFSTGNLLTMTQEVMVLLGFAGVGSLSARWVASSRVRPQPAGGKDAEVRFWALIENDKTLDLFKLQLFLFTLLMAFYVGMRVVMQSAFPVISSEFLLLMGVSNGLYVGSKVGQTNPFAVTQQRKIELDILTSAVEKLEQESDRLRKRGDELTAEIATQSTQQLIDEKKAVDDLLGKATSELVKARSDRDAKDAEYKQALAALPTT
ncbi:hypothetical protein GGE65_007417 [Skermanella aerolata]|uniref:hypothetical protein n=1 Tax=Skermanella aerolata TaxID=393310 RepID=UPI003D1941F6